MQVLLYNGINTDHIIISENYNTKSNKDIYQITLNNSCFLLQTPFLYNCIKIIKSNNLYTFIISLCDDNKKLLTNFYDKLIELDNFFTNYQKNNFPDHKYKSLIRNKNNCEKFIGCSYDKFKHILNFGVLKLTVDHNDNSVKYYLSKSVLREDTNIFNIFNDSVNEILVRFIIDMSFFVVDNSNNCCYVLLKSKSIDYKHYNFCEFIDDDILTDINPNEHNDDYVINSV